MIRSFAALALLVASAVAQEERPSAPPSWDTLTTVGYPGKQDDIVFASPTRGWYVNGFGRIYRSDDGGDTWEPLVEKQGTFYRAIAFVDEQVGVVGTVGVDYFPGVTDDTLMYRTTDGGDSWTAVEGLPNVGGICAIQVLREPFINHGVLDERVRLIAGGRVGGPSALFVSDDLGATWGEVELPERCGMVLDVHFTSRDVGLVAAATSADVRVSEALVLRTTDGGETWEEAYVSGRPFETTWKFSFPSEDVGYVSVQSYDPDPTSSKRVVAKTEDGGETWRELPLVDDHAVRQFGIGFATEELGWVGAVPHAFVTTDGGATWAPADLGRAVNKFRFVPVDEGVVGYAIGVGVHRLGTRAAPFTER